MEFLNRFKEKERLEKALESEKAKLVIIYGRRRCGKSTLIKNTLTQKDVYFMAQNADESIQRMQLANTIGEKIPGFESVVYPDWNSLFTNLNNVTKESFTLCIDEFPYLVKSSTGLPGILQQMIDTTIKRKFHLVLCGSSQQMMKGLVIDSASPLYGRADEIMKITPLEAGWLTIALGCTSENAIAEYSIWGGVPRYWELRAENKSMKSAVINTILDRYGVLHEEPVRLFLDDMRESVQAFSILSVVGSGCNRISEIAGRLNKPATQLSRPIDSLIQLGYLKRELPFGESVKTSKRGIYKIADPFMNFYFSFLAPNLSRLELGLTNQVYSAFEARQSKYVSQEWENLCRRCVPMSPIKGIDFDIASRWWGSNLKKEQMEFDVVAESLDRKVLLIGECKWSKITDSNRIFYELEEKAKVFPFAEGKSIMLALFVKSHPKKNEDSRILGPSDVLERLR